jgi:phosphate transport system protein
LKEIPVKRHFDDELLYLKEKVYKMGLLVEESIRNASDSLFERNSEKANTVIKNDQEINLQEMEVDEMSHQLIALYQPAASDLRLITMVLKITNDLERMGDQGVNIAEAALRLNEQSPLKPYEDLPRLKDAALKMIRMALDSFLEEDSEKAKEVLKQDDILDDLNHKIYEDVQNIMEKKPDQTRAGVSILMVSHNLERVGDLATNIAEDVIYVTQGIDIRHHIRERRNDNQDLETP